MTEELKPCTWNVIQLIGSLPNHKDMMPQKNEASIERAFQKKHQVPVRIGNLWPNIFYMFTKIYSSIKVPLWMRDGAVVKLEGGGIVFI